MNKKEMVKEGQKNRETEKGEGLPTNLFIGGVA